MSPTVSASKFMSFVLRHRPEEINLTLDQGGWADVDELIGKSGGKLDDALVRQVVATNNKRRFALSEDGKRIRANQGHSIPVDLGLVPQTPPDKLFHGTFDGSIRMYPGGGTVRVLESIRDKGLLPMTRHHVHLSADMETARQVADRRRPRSMLFEVNAREMVEAGFVFYCSENGVWLTDHVPWEYLQEVGSAEDGVAGPVRVGPA